MTPAQNAKNARLAYIARTTAYQITVDDSEVWCDATGGAFTVTLPSAVGLEGRCFTVKNAGTANDVTVDSSGGTIDGEASIDVSVKNSMTVISDGANWNII